MAITLTTRLSAGFSGGDAATATSASFTPSANSKLYMAVMIVASGGDGALFDIVHSSNTGGLTFTRVAQSTHSGGGNGGKFALFEASVGGSPSAMTVTFDVDSDGAETSYTWIGAFDATGNSVQIKSGQIATAANLGSGGSTETHTSGTLPAAATTGNTVVMVLGRNNDNSGAAATPSGWTALFNPTDIFVSGVCFYRTGFTGTSVTITDAGEAVFAMGSVLLELEEAGGGGGATVSAVTATATAAAPIPVVRGGSTVAAVTPTATATFLAPAVGSAANIAAVRATATATALNSAVETETVVEGGGPATASAQMLIPGTISGEIIVEGGGPATASALLVPPTVTGGSSGGVTVTAVSATATAAANAPVIDVGVEGTVQAVTAIATMVALVPQVVAIEPTYRFSPPTFEAPMQTLVRPFNYFRLTYAASIVRVNGTLVEVLSPNTDQLTAAGVDGVDYFLGGREYVVTEDVAEELTSAGYTVT